MKDNEFNMNDKDLLLELIEKQIEITEFKSEKRELRKLRVKILQYLRV